MYGLMNEALWRERQRDLLREGAGCGGTWSAEVGGGPEYGVGYGVELRCSGIVISSRPGALARLLGSRGRRGAGGSGDPGGIAWTVRRRSPGSRRA